MLGTTPCLTDRYLKWPYVRLGLYSPLGLRHTHNEGSKLRTVPNVEDYLAAELDRVSFYLGISEKPSCPT